MLKSINLLFSILLLSMNSMAQWNKIHLGISNDLYDVQTSGKHAYICGNNKFYMSRDSGKSWKGLAITVPSNFRCLHFKDTLTGIISGENARIQKTYDGGKSWTQKYVRTASYAYDMTFSGNNGLLVGKDLLILSTGNYGESWTVDTTLSINKNLNSVAITPNGSCWAVGDSGILLNKQINQKKWTNINTNTKINLTNITCFGDSVLIISGGMQDPYQVGVHYNIFMRSTNGGSQWEIITIPEMKTIYASYFLTPDTGFLCGSNGIICKLYHPLNKRGQQITGTASSLNRIIYADNYGLAVGDGGTLLRTTNMGGFGLSVPYLPIHDLALYPNPFTRSIYVHSPFEILEIQAIYPDGRSEYLTLTDNQIIFNTDYKGLVRLCIRTEFGITSKTISKN